MDVHVEVHIMTVLADHDLVPDELRQWCRHVGFCPGVDADLAARAPRLARAFTAGTRWP